MSKRRRYKNPPIEEALCEFRFKPGDNGTACVDADVLDNGRTPA